MIAQTADYWIEKLELKQHPEGGYYREIYRSSIQLAEGSIVGIDKKRNLFTSIYYLLRGSDFSAFHRLKSEEMWHYLHGSPMTIFVINEKKELEKRHLGPDPENLEEFQICIPPNTWFAAKANNPVLYSLVGCTVAPGFDFNDFEMAKKGQFLKDFGHLREEVSPLLRN